MSDSTDEAEQFECETLAEKRGANRVLLSKEAAKEFWALDKRKLAKLVANMELWVEDKAMAENQFNANEGRTKGGINRMLQAFKVHKIRCYGFVCPLKGRKTFVILDIDPAKKSDKGKPRVLERAKERIVRFENKYGAYYE